jgi:tetratricopeptide (TPR) repeat protein
MNDDFNPNKVPEGSGGSVDASLAAALEELIQGRSSSERPAQSDSPVFGSQGSENARAGIEATPCPGFGELALLFGEEAGHDNRTKIDALLAHAAACSHCAVRVRMLAAEVSEGELEMLVLLRCQSPEGQNDLASALAKTPRVVPRKQTPRLYLWGGVGLAASLLIAVGLTSWWRAANNPDRLLAEAYTSARLFDLRMPGAGHAEVTPPTHLRGGAAARESAGLLEARARIERKLDGSPEDPHWLELEARSDILEEKFDPAVEILGRLVAAGPVTPNLLLDDASANFQRGLATGSESDRATALELLRRADELAPDNPVVLFNEAVVMEDRGQFMNAVETWNRYLRFEHDPAWLAEGRRRLEALDLRLNELKSHQSRMERDLTPSPARRPA